MAKKQHGRGKVGADGLTDQQRAYVQARLEDPKRTKVECARRAGVKDARAKACLFERHAAVRLALAAKTRDPKTGKLPKITKEWLQEQMQSIYADVRTPINEKVKLLDKLGATVQGFYVPVGVHHSGKVGLEDVLEAMGGRPADLPNSHKEEEIH